MNNTIILAITALTLVFNTLYNPKSLLLVSILGGILLLINILKKVQVNKILTFTVISYLICSWISFNLSQTANLGLNEMALESGIWIIFLVLAHFKNLNYLKIATGLSILLLLESLFGIGQYLYRDETRAAGSFFSWYTKAEFFPNAYGLFLLLTLPLSFNLKNRLLQFVIISLGFTSLLISFSRGALLVFILQLIIITSFFLFRQKNFQKIGSIILSLLIGFGLFTGLNQIKLNLNQTPKTQIEKLSQKYTFTGTEKITSVNERAQFLTGTSKLILQNKNIFGYGPDSFSYVYPSIQPLFLANAPHPHNWFLKIGLERGVITLILFTGLILILGVHAVSRIIKPNPETSKENHLLEITFFTSIFGAITHNLIDFNLNFTSNFLIFAILLSYFGRTYITNSNFNSKYTRLSLILLPILILSNSYWLFNEFKLKTAGNLYNTNPIQAKAYLQNLNYKNSNFILSDLHTQSQNPDLAVQALQNQTKINKFDAQAYNQLGTLTNQSKYFKQALKLDKKNNWIYYKNYYQLEPDSVKKDQEEVLKQLSEYLELAKQNIHYTAQQNNIVQAQEVAQIFYNQTNKNEFNLIYQDLKKAEEQFKKSN
jgi:O-antigen ligase